MKQLRCGGCNKAVSSLIPDNTIIQAWIECTECLELEDKGEDPPLIKAAKDRLDKT